jgi:hypothetical protein
LENNTTKLAVACWAASVRVAAASPTRAALVRIDVSRRDPLTGLVASPLVGLVPPAPDRFVVEDGDAAGGLDLDQVPEPVPVAGLAPRQRGGSR